MKNTIAKLNFIQFEFKVVDIFLILNEFFWFYTNFKQFCKLIYDPNSLNF